MSAQRRYRNWVSLWSTVCAAWLLFPFFTEGGRRSPDVGTAWCVAAFVPVFIVWFIGYVVLAIGYRFARDEAPAQAPTVQTAKPRRSLLWPMVVVLLCGALAWAIARPDDVKTLRDRLLRPVPTAQPK